MKLLIDARMYGLENTGIGRYLIALIDKLKSTDTEDKFIILLRRKYFKSLTFPKNWKMVLVDIPHYSLSEQIVLPIIINRQKPDLVHFPHINVPLLYKGKYVLTVHDLTMQKQGVGATKLPLPLYYLKRMPFLMIAKHAVDNALKIIVPSKTTATDLANYYDISIQNIEIIYEGYPFKNLLDSRLIGELSVMSKYDLINKDYFFYIGNAFPHKNLEIVIRAFRDLNENKKLEAKFIIAGLKDHFYSDLENYINDMGVSDYVKLIGYVKDEDLPVLYKNSIGFVYPSLTEGFGLQGLEAISMGTTLVCSNIPVFKEIYEFHAFYFDPKDMGSISSTLYSVHNMNKEDKYRYIRSAQKFIEKYSWDKMTKETIDVYRTVTSEK